MDKYVEKGMTQDELTYEQQELLNLVYDEVSDLLLEQIRIVSNMDAISKKPQQIPEILETQISNVNRIGTAAQMIGLHGMHQFCSYIEENFKLIQATDISLLVSLGSKILYWPDVIQTYLKEIYKFNCRSRQQ